MTELTNLPAHWTSLPGRTLKAGGQATVFPIRHDDGREGVFREMRLSPSQAERDRFRRELQILTGSVRHRAIVELFDRNGDIERPWYISELGNSFTSWWRHQKKQTEHDPAGLVDRAIQVLAELASALSVCHKSGVVHRDIKPNNLVVKRGVGEPWPVLIDFGIAHDEAGSRLTPLDGAVGNERFSPDVIVALLLDRGADVNARSSQGFTPLHTATSGNTKPSVIALLLDRGADIEARDSNGGTPLHHAVIFSMKIRQS